MSSAVTIGEAFFEHYMREDFTSTSQGQFTYTSSSHTTKKEVYDQIVDQIFTLLKEDRYRKRNWDGYDAEPINLDSVSMVFKETVLFSPAVPIPELLLDPMGNCMMSWTDTCGQLIITFDPNKLEKSYAYSCTNKNCGYGILQKLENIPSLLSLIKG